MPDNENNPMQETMEMESTTMMQEHMHHERLLASLHNCTDSCEHTSAHLLMHADIENRRKQLELLRDCADICALTGMYVARHSELSKYAANLCAYICSVCGNECLKFRDDESQACGRMCHICAKECSAFAGM